MNKTANTDYRTAKNNLDFVFVMNLVVLQKVHKVGALQTDISQMYIMGAWSTLYMNISWLQRLYDKASLEDSNEIDIELALEGDRAEDLQKLVVNLESALERLENTNFDYLWGRDSKVSNHIFDLMIDNIYTGTYEALAMLEHEINATDKLNDQDDD